MRGSRPGADEIMPERGTRMPWAWAAAGIRGFRACCLRSWRCCVGTSPVLPAVNRVIAAGIPAVAGVPVLEGDVPAGQNQTRPPMYEMGGLARPRSAKRGQLPGFAGAACPTGARYPCEGPVSRLLARSPGVAPKGMPVSDGESISTASANAAQEAEVNYLWILRFPHGVHRRMQLSAPDGGYPPANSQTVHKSPCVTPGTPSPVVAACNRLILSLASFPGNHLVPGIWIRRGGLGLRRCACVGSTAITFPAGCRAGPASADCRGRRGQGT